MAQPKFNAKEIGMINKAFTGLLTDLTIDQKQTIEGIIIKTTPAKTYATTITYSDAIRGLNNGEVWCGTYGRGSPSYFFRRIGDKNLMLEGDYWIDFEDTHDLTDFIWSKAVAMGDES